MISDVLAEGSGTAEHPGEWCICDEQEADHKQEGAKALPPRHRSIPAAEQTEIDAEADWARAIGSSRISDCTPVVAGLAFRDTDRRLLHRLAFSPAGPPGRARRAKSGAVA